MLNGKHTNTVICEREKNDGRKKSMEAEKYYWKYFFRVAAVVTMKLFKSRAFTTVMKINSPIFNKNFFKLNSIDKLVGFICKLCGRFICRSIAFQLRNMTAIKSFIAMSNNASGFIKSCCEKNVNEEGELFDAIYEKKKEAFF